MKTMINKLIIVATTVISVNALAQTANQSQAIVTGLSLIDPKVQTKIFDSSDEYIMSNSVSLQDTNGKTETIEKKYPVCGAMVKNFLTTALSAWETMIIKQVTAKIKSLYLSKGIQIQDSQMAFALPSFVGNIQSFYRGESNDSLEFYIAVRPEYAGAGTGSHTLTVKVTDATGKTKVFTAWFNRDVRFRMNGKPDIIPAKLDALGEPTGEARKVCQFHIAMVGNELRPFSFTLSTTNSLGDSVGLDSEALPKDHFIFEQKVD